ncbi:MAG: hypothetical protein ACWGO1_12805, partial [Anaerolineales bacterium]
MRTFRTKTFWLVLALIAGMLLFMLPAFLRLYPGQSPTVANAQQNCTAIGDPGKIPTPALINFDDLPNAAVIGDHYRPTFGVKFEDNATASAVINGTEPMSAHSTPNVARNEAASTISSVPMEIAFTEPKTHVGFYVGGGGNQQFNALMTAYDADMNFLCQTRLEIVPDAHTAFMGLNDLEGRIMFVVLEYFNPDQSDAPESIDDLYFAPRRGIPPTRTPMPTWTPVPTDPPAPGPTPTPTPIVPMYAYQPQVLKIFPPLFQADLSIHGIEITQGIQCFNSSQGLGGCADNSLPVVNKKDSTARIYLRYSSLLGGSQSSVPVRLYIRANNVWYQANASGKATTA